MKKIQQKIQNRKREIQVRILESLRPNLYTDESVVWMNAEKALMKLSLRELENLNLIMICKKEK